MQNEINYFGKKRVVACDEKCEKAWGLYNRPKEQLSEDDDDYAYLSDDELDIAPASPGTYEGGEGKPVDKSEIPNKWCVRECERCVMSKGTEVPVLHDFSKRLYNQPWKHQ